MAAIDSVPSCAQSWGNTGQPSCDYKIEKLNHLLVSFDGFKVPAESRADWATFLAYMQAATLNNISTRLFPIKKVMAVENATEAPAKMTSGYGYTTKVTERPHQFNIELENLGIGFFKRLRRFNGNKKLRVFWVDDTFIGGKVNSDDEFMGMECSWHLNQVLPGNKEDYTKYILQLELTDPGALTDNLVPIGFPDGFDFEVEFSGITDVTLTATGGSTSLTVTGVTSIAKEDFISLYETELKAASSNCFLINGVPTTPATIANGVASFTGLVPGANSVQLNTPSALAAKGVGSDTAGGYESNIETVTVGGA